MTCNDDDPLWYEPETTPLPAPESSWLWPILGGLLLFAIFAALVYAWLSNGIYLS